VGEGGKTIKKKRGLETGKREKKFSPVKKEPGFGSLKPIGRMGNPTKGGGG